MMATALIRTVLVYLFLIVGIRLMGKRQVGEMEPSELVLAMLISDLAAVPMQDFALPLISGVIPIITLLCITMLLSVMAMKNIRFRKILYGAPTIVVENGKVLPRAMNKVRMSVDELTQELRLQGVTDYQKVKYAILETSGQVSVVLYQSEQPATAAQLRANPVETGLPLVLVNDGRLMEDHLKHRGLERVWLEKQLKKAGFDRYDQVFLMTIDEQDQVYLVAKEETKG
jgi:uncharacterized membrane protein YcaP (DUF421 family)